MNYKLKSSLSLILATLLLFHPDGFAALLSISPPIIELKVKGSLVYIRDL